MENIQNKEMYIKRAEVNSKENQIYINSSKIPHKKENALINLDKVSIDKSYLININISFISNDLINSPTFNMKMINEIKNQIVSKDKIKIKTSLFLLRKYLSYQIQNYPLKNQRVLSFQNVSEIINILFDFLSDKDNQIKFNSLWCIINLTNFNYTVTKYIFDSKRNLDILSNLFFNCDFSNDYFYQYYFILIYNLCMSNCKCFIYFLEKNVNDYLISYLSNINCLKCTTTYFIRKKIIIFLIYNLSIIKYEKKYFNYFEKILNFLNDYFSNLIKKNENDNLNFVYNILISYKENINISNYDLLKDIINKSLISELSNFYLKSYFTKNLQSLNDYIILINLIISFKNNYVNDILIDKICLDNFKNIFKENLDNFNYCNLNFILNLIYLLNNIAALNNKTIKDRIIESGIIFFILDYNELLRSKISDNSYFLYLITIKNIHIYSINLICSCLMNNKYNNQYYIWSYNNFYLIQLIKISFDNFYSSFNNYVFCNIYNALNDFHDKENNETSTDKPIILIWEKFLNFLA